MTVRLEDGPWALTIDPDEGCMLRACEVIKPDAQRAPLLRPAPHGGWADSSMYLLAPWSNRIANARFEFNTVEYTLRPDFPDGSAIHGIVKDHPWRILDRSPISARFGFDSRDPYKVNCPFEFQSVVRYELDGASLHIDLIIQNVDNHPMPCGGGLHPFFMRSLFGSAGAILRAPVSGQYPADNCLPTGPPRETTTTASLTKGVAVAELQLDDCFAGLQTPITINWPNVATLEIACTDEFGHLVVYTPDEDWFCVEPVTMANNGFNNPREYESGVRVLAPHQRLETRTTLTINFE